MRRSCSRTKPSAVSSGGNSAATLRSHFTGTIAVAMVPESWARSGWRPLRSRKLPRSQPSRLWSQRCCRRRSSRVPLPSRMPERSAVSGGTEGSQGRSLRGTRESMRTKSWSCPCCSSESGVVGCGDVARISNRTPAPGVRKRNSSNRSSLGESAMLPLRCSTTAPESSSVALKERTARFARRSCGKMAALARRLSRRSCQRCCPAMPSPAGLSESTTVSSASCRWKLRSQMESSGGSPRWVSRGKMRSKFHRLSRPRTSVSRTPSARAVGRMIRRWVSAKGSYAMAIRSAAATVSPLRSRRTTPKSSSRVSRTWRSPMESVPEIPALKRCSSCSSSQRRGTGC
jgi:hypothetical protein